MRRRSTAQQLRARRVSRQPALAEHEQHDRGDTDCKHQVMGLAELPGKQHGPSEEIMPAARRANQARQLGHGDRQPRPGLEAYQDAVADQLDEFTQAQRPSSQAQRGDGKAGEAGYLRVTLCVALRHRPHGSRDHQ